MVIFLLKCADMGYPHTIAQILGLVQQTLEYKGIKETVTHGWWQRFCQRHTEISLRTAMPLGMARARATDHNCIEKYYDLLEHTLKHNRIFNNSSRIYNCDETGMSLSPKGMKVVAKAGAKSVSSVTGNTKSQVTILACCCANGSINVDLSLSPVRGTRG